jgi:hypothetical protein
VLLVVFVAVLGPLGRLPKPLERKTRIRRNTWGVYVVSNLNLAEFKPIRGKVLVQQTQILIFK